MIYNGSCHCGQIKFQVEGEIKQLMSCNCSICSRKGSLLWFAPREKFRSGKPTAAINARCLENFDFTAVPARAFDGRSL